MFQPRRSVDTIPFRANTEIGQNFLVDPGVVRFILDRAAPEPSDRILEIGPGKGILTKALLDSPAGSVCAVELDRRLEPYLVPLREERFHLVFGDALKTDLAGAFPEPPNRLVANLPYHITTPLLFKILEELHGLKGGLVMVQLEAGKRLVSGPGSKERCPLGILLEALGGARILRRVPPGAFRPIPEVESCLVEFRVERHRDLPGNASFRALLRAGFALRRKTLANALRAGLGLTKEEAETRVASVGDPRLRAEQLTLDQWLRLGGVKPERAPTGEIPADAPLKPEANRGS
jgi:16S rRNA (adenine1518-N6/adenine1519-N6)-dimethyltransferase